MSDIEMYEDQALPTKFVKHYFIKNEKRRQVSLLLLTSVFFLATVFVFMINTSKKPLEPTQTIERAKGLNQNLYGPKK